MHFTKFEALGNDFLLIDEHDARGIADASALAVAMCHRTSGAGADGLLILGRPDRQDAAVAIRIFNADGSEAEVSGNGTRCVAAFLDTSTRWTEEAPELFLSTIAGVKRLTRAGDAGFAMEMGRPSFRAGDIPYLELDAEAPAIEVTLEACGEPWTVTLSSIGNPHCSIFVEDLDEIDWRKVGKAIERHPSFPKRINVEFVRVTSRDRLDVRFWERGVGETQASGTGATAATAAAIATGRASRAVTVLTASGELKVDWPDDEAPVVLTGPARLVYRGEWLGEGPRIKRS